MPNARDIASICAAAGADMPSDTRPLSAPIYQSSVFEIDSLETVDDLYEGRAEGFIYSRDSNPNVSILEKVVAQLENADDSVAFASGMAAIGITLLSMVESGNRIVAGSELYGGTNLMLRQHLSKLGVETQFVDTTDLDAVEQALDSQPRLILVESITNPLLRLTDIESISQMAHQRGVQVVVDNTLASPLLLRPLELGADVT
ncbi:MAG TPA: aminotransferase class V-fold PLP-dependent enzyme, partial [Dehalococcoidia bacterium]|nr:aminotransferase class V-fold PLP-dependent enzyme [Dehalococcoidia bacterium]